MKIVKSIKLWVRKKQLKERYDSNTYVKYLQSKGIRISDSARFFDPQSTTIDTQNPLMIKIGNHVRITRGVTILTHDYSWSVLAGVYGEVFGGVGYVEIGNNVFIGVNSTILKNTIIDDNVIIGAGSIVSGHIESNSVYAGVPAKKIMTLDDFYMKRKASQEKEYNDILTRAKENHYSKSEEENAVKEYFWLFTDHEKELDDRYLLQIERTGYKDKILKEYRK